MARTYYAQLLAAYRWADIRAAIDASIQMARETIEEFGLDRFPTDGVEARVRGVSANCATDSEDLGLIASVYLGQTYRDSPSGSFYAPWSAIPDTIRDKDQRWYEALERAANKYGLEPISGEGDPTDTYVVEYADFEDITLAAALMPNDIGAK